MKKALINFCKISYFLIPIKQSKAKYIRGNLDQTDESVFLSSLYFGLVRKAG